MAQSEATRYSECDQAHNRPKRNAFRDLLGLLASLLAISVGWMGSFCWAESDTTLPDARESLTRGTIEAGGAVGFWHEFLFPSESHSANREAVLIMPRFGMVVTDEVKAGTLTGNLEVLAEPVFGQFTHPYSGQLAGGSLVFKYNLLSFGRWMPFWDAGGGMIWTHAHRIHEQGSPFNFILETGPGIQYFVTTRVTLTFGIRYSHISNAGLSSANLGLDAILPYAGVSWFLPKY